MRKLVRIFTQIIIRAAAASAAAMEVATAAVVTSFGMVGCKVNGIRWGTAPLCARACLEYEKCSAMRPPTD